MAREDRSAWLAQPGMPQELLEQLRVMDEEEASDSFYRDLAFGTGGLRGVQHDFSEVSSMSIAC